MKPKTKQLLLIAGMAMLFLAACKHDPQEVEPSGNNNDPDTSMVNCDTLSVTYAGSVFPIFESNCVVCHSGPDPDFGIDLTNYDDVAVIAQNGTLLGALKRLDGYYPMPKDAPPLDACEIRTIEIWINDTTFTEPPSGDPCDPDTVYFEQDLLPILQSSCALADCHDDVTQQDGVRLTDYASVMATADVDPYDPEGSDLYEVLLENDPDKRMPPPPNNPLTQEQIDMVYKWIAQGAQDLHCDEDCDTLNVSFGGTIWPMVQNSCFGCHSGANPEGGIPLENHNDLVAVAQTGQLMGTLNWEAGYANMPRNGMQWSDCDRRAVEIWIEDGMPNN